MGLEEALQIIAADDHRRDTAETIPPSTTPALNSEGTNWDKYRRKLAVKEQGQELAKLNSEQAAADFAYAVRQKVRTCFICTSTQWCSVLL
jgi:hypothetical protein